MYMKASHLNTVSLNSAHLCDADTYNWVEVDSIQKALV